MYLPLKIKFVVKRCKNKFSLWRLNTPQSWRGLSRDRCLFISVYCVSSCDRCFSGARVSTSVSPIGVVDTLTFDLLTGSCGKLVVAVYAPVTKIKDQTVSLIIIIAIKNTHRSADWFMNGGIIQWRDSGHTSGPVSLVYDGQTALACRG